MGERGNGKNIEGKYCMRRSDIIIIGAGGVGCAVARELSRYKLSVTVLEKECDVAAGASGRNSAVVHAGIQLLCTPDSTTDPEA